MNVLRSLHIFFIVATLSIAVNTVRIAFTTAHPMMMLAWVAATTASSACMLVCSAYSRNRSRNRTAITGPQGSGSWSTSGSKAPLQ
jgi:hypothetical protein